MQKITINTRFLDNVIDDDNVKQLAVFIKLKSVFSNGCIYNYSYQRISRISGISINVLKQCINFFKENGWCRHHHGNLIFNNMFHVDGKTKRKVLIKIKVNKTESYRDLIKRLRITLVQRANDRFEFAKKLHRDDNVKNEENSAMDYQEIKKHNRLFKKYASNRVICESERFSMSNRSIGNLFGLSKTSASKLMKWGVSKGILKTESRRLNLTLGVTEAKDALINKLINRDRESIFYSPISRSFVMQYPNFITF